jgi:predicted metallo-beta-lactamase superfamily hydrolase
MNFNDAQMSDITVVLDKRWEAALAAAVEELKKAGVEVRSADDSNSVVEGVIESAKVRELEKLECVDYVRTTFSWIADYPPGDPRDQDKVARESDD